MIKRPSAQDDEDELVRMQTEYLSSKQKPSATVVRLPKKKKSEERDIVTLTGKGPNKVHFLAYSKTPLKEYCSLQRKNSKIILI